ncbi:MAG TPA: hypothetical protein VF457_13080 [Burkholderiaceae bacterium]
MAVESDLDRAQYATNGTTGPWTVPFYFLIDTDLQVTYTAADGTETTLSLNSDYSVTGAGNPNGGTVTTTADYAAGGFITVLRDMEFVQEVVYPESGPFPAKTHETALDRLTMMAQQLREQVGRALSFGAGEVGSAQLPSASDRKGKIIGFDAVTGALILIAGSIGSALDLATQYASSTGSTLMGFIQSAAGAIATTVAKKLARVLDAVVDFGADPTGATNSTVALQAFYAACITSGKRGYIPPGTYLVTPGQLVFTATTYQAWPHIETAGHWCTTFKVDPSTHVNAPILAWNNGVQTSTAPSAQWYGGSHGGVTFLDTTGDSAPLRSGMSFAGMWGIEFGWIKGQSLTGDVITVPNLVVGTDPDAYAVSDLRIYHIEAQSCAGWMVQNLNGVGMDSWMVETFYCNSGGLGGVFGAGDGMYWLKGAISNTKGWAWDDGGYAGSAVGGGNRNTYGVLELDNVQYGIRLNHSYLARFLNVRFNCRYQFGANTTPTYWPLTAVSMCDGMSPSCKDTEMSLYFRIEGGGSLADLGTFVTANDNGNVLGVEIKADYQDDGALGVTDSLLFTNFRNTVAYCTRRTRELIDTRDKALVFARGSASTSVPNSGYAGATAIAFPTSVFPTASTNYDGTSSTFTAPRTGLYYWEAALPLALTIGTRVRIGVVADGLLSESAAQYSVNAATVSYQASGYVILQQGQTVYLTADQNTGGSVSCSPVSTNDEVRFVVIAQ